MMPNQRTETDKLAGVTRWMAEDAKPHHYVEMLEPIGQQEARRKAAA